MLFFLLFICNIVFFVEWGEGGEGVSQDGVAIRCLPQDVVLLGVTCHRTLCCCCAVSCAVFTGLLLLLCCLHLPRSVVLSSPASFCCVVFTNVATRYGLMRLTGLIKTGKAALDVKLFILNICHYNLLE